MPAGTATAFYEEEATLEALWDKLPEATLLHLACHARFDPDEPLESALMLADELHLRLRALLNAGPERLARLRLAFLSACQTAVTDFQRVPDEVVGLPAGFLQAGVPSVIGTLWRVADESTALLVMRFYELYLHGDEELGVEAGRPVSALGAAQRWLRDVTNAKLRVYLEQHERMKEGETAASRMSRVLLAEGSARTGRAIRWGARDERPYGSPYFWAPFVYWGAFISQKG